MNRAARGGLVWEESPLIAAPHAFSTRVGGVSEGVFASLNLGPGRGDERRPGGRKLRPAGPGAGLRPGLLRPDPSGPRHRRPAHHRRRRAGLDAPRPDCDILITDRPGAALVVFGADCPPVLLYDPETGAVGAAHCGWRGTAQGCAAAAVRAMAAAFGSRPEALRCAIGPGIGPCCFETDGDVPAAMRAALGPAAEPYLRPAGAKWHVDLPALNRLWLERAGVTHIDVSNSCTACLPELFWSHRRMGAARGSQIAVIVCGGAA